MNEIVLMNLPNNVFPYNFTSLFETSELFYDTSTKMHVVMFGLVYGLTVAVIISSFLYKKQIKTDYIKETQVNVSKTDNVVDYKFSDENYEVSKDNDSEYEKDSEDDQSSVEDDTKSQEDVTTNEVVETVQEEYQELSSLFQYSLTRRQLVKVVGYKFRNLRKKDLVKLAIEKVKSDAINNALENFKYFNPSLKAYVKTNRRVYQNELQQLFSNSENNFNKNLVNNNG